MVIVFIKDTNYAGSKHIIFTVIAIGALRKMSMKLEVNGYIQNIR